MKVLLFLIGIIIGLGVGWRFAPKPQPKAVSTTTVQVQTVGKSFLNPREGDVLKWTDGKGNPLPVTFKFGSPCKEADTTSTCSIAVTGGFYKYTCPTCLDPGVRVGSGGGGSFVPGRGPTMDTQRAKETANTAEPPDPFVFCDSSSHTATVQPIKAHVNDQIQWFPAAQIASQEWHVTVAANVCKEGTTFAPPAPNQPTELCTVLKSDTYNVQADACPVRTGSAELQIVPGTSQSQ